MELEEILPLKEKYFNELKAIAELEKHNEMLAHQLKYAENILTDVQADKFNLRQKLEIAVEALEKIAKEHYGRPSEMMIEAREALAAIEDDKC